MIKGILRKVIPKSIKKKLEPYRKQWQNFKILAFEYGQWKTIKNWECIDKKGEPVPWFTYPAIEYLSHLDLSDFLVYEYGSGNSTLFWFKRVKEVVSVEHDKGWYEQILKKIDGIHKVKYFLFENAEDYINSLTQHKQSFDIYVIDGRWRGECAKTVLKHINQYGGKMVIFDNSDWYPNAIRYLRQNLGWIQVDFHGFAPINNYTLTTTIFLNKSITLKYKSVLFSLKAIKQNAEDDLNSTILEHGG